MLVGETSSDVVFTVKNNGTAASGALTVAFGGANADEFITTSTCPSLLSAETCSVAVRFKPASEGDKSAALTIGGATASAVNAALTGLGLGVLSVSRRTRDFGSAALDSTGGATAAFTVKNNNPPGGAPSGVITSTLTLGMPPQFAIVSDLCFAQTLAAQGTCTVTVRFTPSATIGPRMGGLSVVAAGGGVASASFSGTAVSPLSVSETSFDYGSVVIGTFVERTFTFTNAPATPPTAVLSTSLKAADAALFDYAVVGDTCAGHTLAAGAACAVKVRFIPSAVGPETAAVTVTASPILKAAAGLKGVGTPPPSLALTPPSYKLDDVFAGSSTAEQTFTVTNPVLDSVTSALALSVSGAGFALTGGTCVDGATRLTGGHGCTLIVRYSAAAGTAAGAKTGALSVTASAGGIASAALGVTVKAQLSLSPPALDFGKVVFGQTGGDRTFTVKNDSPTAVPALGVALSGANLGEFEVPAGGNTCGTGPAPDGGTCTFVVRLKPTAVGAKTRAWT